MCPVVLGRAGSVVSMGHIFPQGVLAALTLVGGGAGDGGPRAPGKYDLCFASAQ